MNLFIEAERTLLEDGSRIYNVRGVQAIELKDLPRVYTELYPHCGLVCTTSGDSLVIAAASDRFFNMTIGADILAPVFEQQLEIVHQCSIRLRDIHSLHAGWFGITEVLL